MKTLFQIVLSSMIALLPAVAAAAPFAYSVNSDQPFGDTLYMIDLADGTATPIGTGVTLPPDPFKRLDIEGLAIAPDLTLWGVDEDLKRLFAIDTNSGTVVAATDEEVDGVDGAEGNDFGLTFTCNGDLYAVSVRNQTLYTLGLDGVASPVGGVGNLGANISAIAAHGSDPVKMYGLGNGWFGEAGPVDNRSLYEINLDTGTANLIGSLGPVETVANYTEAGLGFDLDGNLWAITDRSQFAMTSQVLQIDPATGLATNVLNTSIIGFESLAVAPPGACNVPVQPDHRFETTVQVPTLSRTGIILAVLFMLLAASLAPRLRRR
ncbi:MAG: hypothetical protein HKN15_08445 [Xanthomonadales bacterium]|nr:hypothetical protein [Xanthomonadales bacterium]